jgi:hypothetical protein
MAISLRLLGETAVDCVDGPTHSNRRTMAGYSTAPRHYWGPNPTGLGSKLTVTAISIVFLRDRQGCGSNPEILIATLGVHLEMRPPAQLELQCSVDRLPPGPHFMGRSCDMLMRALSTSEDG